MRYHPCFLLLFLIASTHAANADDRVTRVFIFAGQSNMVGSDSHVEDIARFPPFHGLEQAQPDVKFSYCIGRENKTRSNGWVDLAPVNGIVGPELSFAREVRRHIDDPIVIIKCAAGGTHLGGDWNPDHPQGFKMYPLALQLVRDSLQRLDQADIKYRVEGFMWHQGENDMFNKDYMPNYGANLENYLMRWRRDLQLPNLRFYIGELCTKTIWGMDLRPRMYAISLGQKEVTATDPNAQYVPTSHVGVEIGGGVGLHYHYGTLGQLQHGLNYAHAYLRNQNIDTREIRNLDPWPHNRSKKIKLFVLAGHRNMEGERAFESQLRAIQPKLAKDQPSIPFRYSMGGGVWKSNGWEALGLTGYYNTFGPELSFSHHVQSHSKDPIAIAKFTHSGSQINDWTPEGSVAQTRHLYPRFLQFIRESIRQLKERHDEVELTGVFYHLGENDMSMPPYRKDAGKWLSRMITQSRVDLEMPKLRWIVSQQPPTDHKNVDSIDVVADIEAVARDLDNVVHLKVFDFPPQEKQLVLDAAGIIHLGTKLGEAYSGSLP